MAGVAEAYLPAFALAIGMSPVLAGLVATLPLLAGGVLQLLAPRAIPRTSSLRRWAVGSVLLQALAFVPLVALALCGGPAIPIVFGAAAIYWAAGMSSSAGWTPWMARVVPARLRGRFFARRHGLLQATTLLGMIGSGAALNAFGVSHVRTVYAAMFAAAALGRVVSAVMLARQGQGVDETPRRRMRFRSIPPKLRGTGRASLLGYLIATLAAASISSPFLAPYLLRTMGLDYVRYSIYTATIVVAKIVALPILGRLMSRAGVRRVLTVCAFGIAPIPLIWIMVDSFTGLIALQIYGGIVWAGFELGMLLALFDAADDAERTTMQVAFSALQSFGTAAASLVGGAVLGTLGSDHHAYVWVFVLSAAARLAAVLLLVRQLRRLLVAVPFFVVGRAWTLAMRGVTAIRDERRARRAIEHGSRVKSR
jgi:MFS family permease